MSTVSYANPAGLLAGSIVMEVVSGLCVGLRFFSRRWKGQRIVTSDWLILATFVFATGLTALEIYGIEVHALAYPIGGSIEDPAFVTRLLNTAKFIEFSYLVLGVVGVGLLKLSICLLYWELFAKVMFRRFLIFWTITVCIWTLGFVLALFLECRTHFMALFAQPADYTEYCQSAIPSGWALSGTDVATDVITLMIPIPVILKLHMSRRNRILALSTFLIGALSVVASTIKAYIYIKATLSLYDEDAILILTGISVWNLAEIHIGIIAACGPALRAFVFQVVSSPSVVLLLQSWKGKSKSSVGSGSRYDKMRESEERRGSQSRQSSALPGEHPRANRAREHELQPLSNAHLDISRV